MMDQRVRWTVVGFVALMLALGSAVPGQATPVPFFTGFEVADGGLGGWTNVGVTINTSTPHTPLNAANFVASTSLTRTIPLVTATGQFYKIDFWLRPTVGATNDFHVVFGTTTFDLINLPSTGYTEYTFFAPAASTSTAFAFSVGSAGGGNFRLDDVSVVATPEPASLALLGLGLVGLVGYQWRRRQRATK